MTDFGIARHLNEIRYVKTLHIRRPLKSPTDQLRPRQQYGVGKKATRSERLP